MKELLRTNDPVLLSYVSALLEEGDIAFMVADTNMSVLEGSIGVLPRRVLVEDHPVVRRVTAARLMAAGEPVRVLQASSGEIFGDAGEVPQRESTPIRPVTPREAPRTSPRWSRRTTRPGSSPSGSPRSPDRRRA